MDIHKYLKLIWAKLSGDKIQALLIRKELLMADFSKLSADVDALVAKYQGDAVTAAAAAAAVETATQAQIDALDAKLAAALDPPPAA